MKRKAFVITGSALALAACGGHGSNLLPSAGAGSGDTAAAVQRYSQSDQDKYAPLRPLPRNPILGEARRFDGATAPAGWAFCDGRELSIARNPALYRLLARPSKSTLGKTTFTLPKSNRFTMVIAISGATPKSPRELAAIFAARPDLDAKVSGALAR